MGFALDLRGFEVPLKAGIRLTLHKRQSQSRIRKS